MGKIRVKTLGVEEVEEKQKKRDAKRRAVKRAKKEGVAPEELLDKKDSTKSETAPTQKKDTTPTETVADQAQPSVNKARLKRVNTRSKRYKDTREKVDRTKFYAVSDAIALVKDTANTQFTGSIEAHFNLTRKPKDLNLKKDKALPVSYEKKFPLAHAKLGSTKDTEKKLSDQLSAIVKKIGKSNIRKTTLSSTMGPGVKVSL